MKDERVVLVTQSKEWLLNSEGTAVAARELLERLKAVQITRRIPLSDSPKIAPKQDNNTRR